MARTPVSPFVTPSDSPPNAPLLALDLDDVLMATNANVARWHTRRYSPMSLQDFHYYHYWKNPGWGNPQQTMEKVKEFYESSDFTDGYIVDGAVEGVWALRKLGFRLVIVTARSTTMAQQTESWVRANFPGCFEGVRYTGAFEKKKMEQTMAGQREVTKKLEKIEVLRELGAVLLVDDSLENAVLCATDSQPVPVLLFGNWPWNRRRSWMRSEPGTTDYLSYTERQALGLNWQDDTIPDDKLPSGIQRVLNWPAVVDAARRFLVQ